MRPFAKAPSAGSTKRHATGPGQVTRLTLLLALAAAAFLLAPVSPAAADGTVNVTVTGSGSGAVTSTCASSVGGTCTPAPAQINCTEAGGPTCGVFFDFDLFGFNHEGSATLTATPASGSLFAGWTQSGASGSERCTTPPQVDPTCKVALNPAGPGPTSTVTAAFVAVPDKGPLASTGATAAGVASYLRTLQGTVDPEGFELTDCHFEYGTTTEYGATTPCSQSAAAIGDGSTPVAVSASTEPLEPDTTYHYRLVASNLIGSGEGDTSEGEDQTFTTGPFVDECSDPESRERRAEQGIVALLLPDCMALEMVSPPVKGGQSAKTPHVSADGERVRFDSAAALGGSPGVLGFSGNPYVATRSGSGWSPAPTVPPLPFVSGWSPNAEAKSLTPDFSSWFQVATTSSLRDKGQSWAFRAGLGGVFEQLSPLLVPTGGGEAADVVRRGYFQGASADHSHLLFAVGGAGSGTADTSYLPHDPAPAGPGSTPNAYIAKLDYAGQPSLQLLARGIDPKDGKVKVFGGNCGARVGNVEGRESSLKRNQGAVSTNGDRVLFSTRPEQPASGNCSTANGLRILERLQTAAGPTIRPLYSSECDRAAPACSSANGDDRYQGASVDQSKVYFTTTRQLAGSDLDEPLFSDCANNPPLIAGCDLYLYDSSEPQGERLIQVSAGENVAGKHETGKDAKVLDGTVAISGDGSHVYFVAEGVLTDDPSPGGKKASEFAATAPKLYLYQRDEEHPDGELAFIGALDPGDKGLTDLWGGEGTFRNSAYPVPARDESGEGGGEGDILLFISRAALTADDTDGTARDVYRYDAGADQLLRLSKAAAGGSDNGAFDVAGVERGTELIASGTDFAEFGRWASEDGQTVVFRTAEALIPGDANGESDSYMWRAGELLRLPGSAGSNNSGENRPTLSHDGSTVAFQADPKLLPVDGDSNADVYVARVNGGFPNPPAPEVCTPTVDCQGAATSPPPAPGNTSATAPSTGNVVSGGAKPKRCPKGKRKARRAGKVRCVARNNAQRKAKSSNRQADTDRRAGK